MAKGRRKTKTEGTRRPNWVEKAGVLAAFASVIVAIFALADHSGSSAGGSLDKLSAAKLSLVDLTVKENPGLKPHASLEMILHNTGGRLVVIDGARVEVLHSYELPRCASQDDLPSSGTYGMPLSVLSKPGDVLTQDLHQQVGADEADRFEIALGPKWPRGEATSTVYLFEVSIGLHTDAPQRYYRVGKALISLPTPPYPGEYYWNAETPKIVHDFVATASQKYIAEMKRRSMPCWRENTADLRSAFTSRAVRSSDLDEVQRNLISPKFPPLE